MRALIAGGGMGGLMTALALRESGIFDAIDVFEQTPTPSTAGAGLNIPPNGARLCRWLGVDLDGGDPKGPDGAVDGGRAAILESTRMIWEDNSVSEKPLDHNTAANDNAGFHHMHRLDLLMCLYKRVFEFAPETGANSPIQVHMAKQLADVGQDDDSVTVTFSDGTTETGDLLIGADGVNSQVLEAVWPGVSNKRWTEVTVYRGVVPRDKVATARKLDGSPLDHNPIDASSMDSRDHPYAQSMSYWIRGHELLNVWLAYYEPNSEEFEGDEGDWFPVDHEEMLGNMAKAFGDDPRRDDVLALASLIERPTKWGLYDRDALENWTEGRVGLLGDAAHPMLPTFGQGAAQSFEDAAALGKCFELHGTDIYRALLHYERVRYYRATRFQFASKFLFKHLEPEDTPQRRQILKALNERDYPVFDHTERAGSDDSWIYAFDARNIGDKLPIKKLGPWDFRSREDALTARKEVARSLWKPAKPLTGDRPVTREELAQHATFDDCWVVIRGKVYDFTDWKHHHPGGPFVARMYAGKDATAEFGDYHTPLAERHMEHFCVGPLVGAPAERAGDAVAVEPTGT
jgi:salicylate hydroxylase